VANPTVAAVYGAAQTENILPGRQRLTNVFFLFFGLYCVPEKPASI
jgi:hypothetical protein